MNTTFGALWDMVAYDIARLRLRIRLRVRLFFVFVFFVAAVHGFFRVCHLRIRFRRRHIT